MVPSTATVNGEAECGCGEKPCPGSILAQALSGAPIEYSRVGGAWRSSARASRSEERRGISIVHFLLPTIAAFL